MTNVLSVASEIFPLVKTGGLADVAGALPGALAGAGVNMSSLVPGYPKVLERLDGDRVVAEFDDLFGARARLLEGRAAGLNLFVLESQQLFTRPGNPYVTPDGLDWADNWRRFAALSWVGAEIGLGLVEGYSPDILHAHDWQAGLVPAYVKYGPRQDVKTVMTVHNMAFKGFFGAEIFGELRLPPHALEVGGVEFYGQVSYLKAGMECADFVTTVSPGYANEIRTSDFGMGLEGLLSGRTDTVAGILNGIDTEVWDPETDPALPRRYSGASLNKRSVNRAAIEERFGLSPGEGPLFCVVSRLTGQKGMDLLLNVLPGLVALGGRLAVLGSGDHWIEDGFRAAAARFPGQVSIISAYDEPLSHLMQGGADAILIPSRFEPCGLTQLYGLRYGCVPVVARVGGLADTIIDANHVALAEGVATGIQHAPDNAHALYEAIRRAVALHADERTWRRLQRRGMRADVSWDASARAYADLYKKLTTGLP